MSNTAKEFGTGESVKGIYEDFNGISTNGGVMSLLYGIPNTKEGESDFTGSRINYKVGNTVISVKAPDGKEIKDLLKHDKQAAKVLTFLLTKATKEKSNEFYFDVNEYFEAAGIKRNKRTIDALDHGLHFLASSTFSFVTKTRKHQKPVEYTGNGLLYHFMRNPDAGQKHRKLQLVKVTLGSWADSLRDGAKMPMLYKGEVLKLTTDREQLLALKLAEKYRNNVNKRAPDDPYEKLSVETLLKVITSEKQLKNKGSRMFIDRLYKYLLKMEERGIITDWHIKNEKEKSRCMKRNDVIVYNLGDTLNKIYAPLKR